MNNLKILGCLSPYPTKDDNCIGYLINSNLMLDCGPGSSKELDIKSNMEGLSIIISHFHKDHYSDLFAIAYASYVYSIHGLLKERIKVYIPKTEPEEKGHYDYDLIKNLKTSYFDLIEYDENTIINDKGYTISFMRNYHPIRTYSVKIVKDNSTLVYTADVGNKSAVDLINFSKDADLLLIESSLLNSDNPNENHLTANQAATIGKASNAKQVILTHFWPEYTKEQYLQDITEDINVDIAGTCQTYNY